MSSSARIGPGRLVLVVGPSGAGKDTLIAGARRRLAASGGFVFPQRVVTRASTADEVHHTADAAAFSAAEASGGFALSWRAHDLGYGVPADIDAAIADGAIVVVNVSRAVVAAARQRYSNVTVVLVDAPVEARAQRIAARGREAADGIAARLRRQVDTFSADDADACIDNAGSVEAGIEALFEILMPYRR